MTSKNKQRPEPTLTAAQLEIMNLFWEQGELGVAQVWRSLGARRPVARNTVQTMLTRLVERGWLEARPDGNAFCFRALRPRKSTLREMVNKLLDTAFDGSASGLVMTLLENRHLSTNEAQRIREMIDQVQEVKR
jgi:BlaI family penicillinase repressor